MFLLPHSYFEIRDTKLKGKGIFAKKDIVGGLVIGDYLGTIISSEDEEKYEEKYGFYTMYYTDDFSIFPNLQKPGLHLLNHSCNPNCFMYTYRGHTLFFALRDIKKGEELTISYLLSPKDKDCNPCTHACFCKDANCKGTMHVEQELFDKWLAFDDKMLKKTKMEKVEIGQKLRPLPFYPTFIPYDPIYSLFTTKKPNPSQEQDQRLFLPQLS